MANVSKLNAYAVLKPTGPQASKLNAYAILNLLGPQVSKINAYAVLAPRHARVSKLNAYAVLKPVTFPIVTALPLRPRPYCPELWIREAVTRAVRKFSPAPPTPPPPTFDQVGKPPRPFRADLFPSLPTVHRVIQKRTPMDATNIGGRASQVVTETGAFGTPNARASQISIQTGGFAAPNARASQVATETGAFGVPNARASQLTLQPLGFGTPNVQASQIVLELALLDYYQPSAPLVYPTLPGLTFPVTTRPKFLNLAQQHSSGREVRASYSAFPIWEFELDYSVLRETPEFIELREMMGFFYESVGTTTGFLFKNPDDNSVAGQSFTTTDGHSVFGPLVRTYCGLTEPVGFVDVTLPFTLYIDSIEVDRSDYFILQDTPGNQLIKFRNTPAAGKVLTVDMSYFYWCRFGDDSYDFQRFMHRLWELAKVTLVAPRGRRGIAEDYFGYVV